MPAGLHTSYDPFFLRIVYFLFVVCGCATWHTGSFPMRDQTYAPYIGSSESEPLDCQGSPILFIIGRLWLLSLMDEILICLPVCFQLSILPSPLSFPYDWNQSFSHWYSTADFSLEGIISCEADKKVVHEQIHLWKIICCILYHLMGEYMFWRFWEALQLRLLFNFVPPRNT